MAHKVEITLTGEDFDDVSRALDCATETAHFYKDLICKSGLDYKETAKKFVCEIKWSVEKSSD